MQSPGFTRESGRLRAAEMPDPTAGDLNEVWFKVKYYQVEPHLELNLIVGRTNLNILQLSGRLV